MAKVEVMTTSIQERSQKLSNFIILPRQIVSDRREGKISLPEFDLYVWVRLNANPYGVAVANQSALREDRFPHLRTKRSDNYINKLLLSLKRKKYIYYQDRQGKRGSFEVHFGDWVLPSSQVKSLDRYFNEESATEYVEVSQTSQEEGQK